MFQEKNESGQRYIIFMVGLPARGKSYISTKLCRYLSWAGYTTKVFNVGSRRRLAKAHDSDIDISHSSADCHSASFFDPENTDACAVRTELAMNTLNEIFNWLETEGKVAIHDATNSSVLRRTSLLEKVSHHKNIKAFFIESICTDTALLEKNIQMKLKGPDYLNMDHYQAITDFRKRIDNYEKTYQALGDYEESHDISFIKLVNVGKKVVTNEIRGYLASQCVLYLMQIHIKERTIWLTRHGESEYNVCGKIGGDSLLTPSGSKYASAMASFIKNLHPPVPIKYRAATDDDPAHGLSIWTSCLQRTIQTSLYFNSEDYDIQHIRALNELYAGNCENMSFEDVKKYYNDDYQSRLNNKLTYRYPGGESYADVIDRLSPIILELERLRSDVLIVTHQVVTRTLLAYFLGIPLEKMTTLSVPLHSLFRLEPRPYGASITRFAYDSETDSFHEQPFL